MSPLDETIENKNLQKRVRSIFNEKPHLDMEESIEYHDRKSKEDDVVPPYVTVGTYGHLLASIKTRLKKLRKTTVNDIRGSI